MTCDCFNSGVRRLFTGTVEAVRGFDFRLYREIVEGGEIVSGTAIATNKEGDGTVTLGSVTVADSVVNGITVEDAKLVVPITAPTRESGDSLWSVEFLATLDTGAVIVGCGTLEIIDGCANGDDEDDCC